MFKNIVFASIFAGAVAMAALYDPHTTLVVETFSGDMFVAGSGSNCLEAHQNAVFPNDWQKLYCERVWF